MAIRCARLLVAACFALAGASVTAQSLPTVAPDSLIAALGGKPGIDALIEDFVPRLAADPKIGAFFRDTHLPELTRQLADQLCALAGGPCVYEGGDMKKVHADMRVAKADFNRLVEVLQLSMDARGIAFATQNRLLARLAPMHREIVSAP